MILGSHVSFNKEQLLGSTKEAISYGANTFMFYTGAPQNTVRKPIEESLTNKALELMKENNIDIKNVICHAPYIVNLANKKDPEKWNFSISFIKSELDRCDSLGVEYMVLHPGSAVGITREEGLSNISEALNHIVGNNKCIILLETMAGKGNECGRDIDEIKYIISHVSGNLGVCIDTCHINDAGYDLNDFDGYLNEFAEKIGLDKIKCIHVNDSKNERESHKDRHANIGYGTIGFDVLNNIVHHDKLKDVPKILETPYVGKTFEDKEKTNPPYKFEIEMFLNNKFNSNLLEDINNYYK